MSVKWIVLIVVAALVGCGLVGVIGTASYVYGIREKAIDIETNFEAQVSVNKSMHDKMWKIISQKAQIKDSYAEDFGKNFSAIMEGRYGNPDNRSNSMMLWIQEKNPDFSIDLYKDLSQAVEAQRTEFHGVQARMIDLKREHDRLLKGTISQFAMFGKTELKLQLVTSGRTENAFNTGKDDDVELSKKKEPATAEKN